jgi:hypothetical protein
VNKGRGDRTAAGSTVMMLGFFLPWLSICGFAARLKSGREEEMRNLCTLADDFGLVFDAA